ncbi:unnamed protein product, partial [Ectocarpus fasciculatus]
AAPEHKQLRHDRQRLQHFREGPPKTDQASLGVWLVIVTYRTNASIVSQTCRQVRQKATTRLSAVKNRESSKASPRTRGQKHVLATRHSTRSTTSMFREGDLSCICEISSWLELALLRMLNQFTG